MRDCSPECGAYLDAHNVAYRADLLTLTLGNGSVYRWTTWNTDLTVQSWNLNAANANRLRTEGTHTFKARSEAAPTTSAPIIDIGSENEDEGLSVCSLDITLSGQSFTVGGKSLMMAAADGLLKGAWVTLDHLIMATAGDVSLQSFIDFDGFVDTPDIGVSEVTLRCKSWLAQAESILLPKRTYAPNCAWEHLGPECGLDRTANTTTGNVAGPGSDPLSEFFAATSAHNQETYTSITVVGGGLVPVVHTEIRGWWDLGVITWDGNVTAALAGVRSDVLSGNVAGIFVLANPAPIAPAAGDTFVITSGCNQDSPSCTRYSNLARFGGFKFIPPNSTTPVR